MSGFTDSPPAPYLDLGLWIQTSQPRASQERQSRPTEMGGACYKSVLVMPYCMKERRLGPFTLHYLSSTVPPTLHTPSALCLTYKQRGKRQGTRLGLNLISASLTQPSSPPWTWEHERRLASAQMGNVPIHQPLLLLFLQAAGEAGTG